MTWLNELLDATSEVETPRSFVLWAGLTAISAVAGRKCYLEKHYYRLYPNIYVLLIARSGLRKTFAVNSVAKPLVELVGGTRIISGRNSIQGILQELSTSRSFSNGRAPLTEANAFINSGEFSNLIINDPSSLTILTDLYDSHYNPEWDNTLKSGKEKLKNVYVTMLGATNHTHLKDRISDIDIEGGFIARTLMVMEDKKALINPLTEKPKNEFNIKKLAEYLREVAKLTGEFKYTEAGKKYFEEWYREYNKETRDDKTGTAERLHDHVLKIAMNYSMSRSLTMELDSVDIEFGVTLCQQFTANVKSVTSGRGKNPLASQTVLVITELLSAKDNRVSKKVLLGKHYGELDAKMLDNVIQTLYDMGVVMPRTLDGDTYYQMNAKSVADFKKQMRVG